MLLTNVKRRCISFQEKDSEKLGGFVKAYTVFTPPYLTPAFDKDIKQEGKKEQLRKINIT